MDTDRITHLHAVKATMDLLVAIIDINAVAWQSPPAARTPFKAALEACLVLLNAYVSLDHENRLAVILCSGDSARFAYPTPLLAPPPPPPHSLVHSVSFETDAELQPGVEEETEQDPGQDVQMGAREAHTIDGSVEASPLASKAKPRLYKQFNDVASAVSDSLVDLVGTSSSLKDSSFIPRALSLALCHINRQTLTQKQLSPDTPLASRILVFSPSIDSSSHYIPLMNSIFAAQKASIPIDVVRIGSDSEFLKGAAWETKGVYQLVNSIEELLPKLLFAYLQPPNLRTTLIPLSLPTLTLRATCFCHSQVVDMAFVCGNCLSVFCSDIGKCLTCGE